MKTKRKKRKKKNNKNKNMNFREAKLEELDPINALFLVIKKNKFKLISIFISIFSAVFFAIRVIALNLWGVKPEFIFRMIPNSFLEYFAEIITLICVTIFTIGLEIIERKKMNKIIYLSYIIISSIIVNLLLINNLFILCILICLLFTYSVLYLIFIRPFYLSKDRKLAQNALNYHNKKYKIQVIVSEYLGVVLHFLLVVAIVGNIYSILPSNHLIDKTGEYIVISSTQDKALISKFSIENNKSGTSYIMLNKETIKIVSLSKLECISQNKKLPIFKE
ncbi:MAG: hypothetical protein SPH93_08245 [Clostridium sp.]|uniref:hypothetical protein n=1 Tax=Clostridium sp. TaxID=1506 RepID=UPI0025EFEFF9|nr:hypothetical protein [Clostridium sp.]MDY6227640.1 hypothetical protein [Clostridium sp.]